MYTKIRGCFYPIRKGLVSVYTRLAPGERFAPRHDIEIPVTYLIGLSWWTGPGVEGGPACSQPTFLFSSSSSCAQDLPKMERGDKLRRLEDRRKRIFSPLLQNLILRYFIFSSLHYPVAFCRFRNFPDPEENSKFFYLILSLLNSS